MVHTEHALKIQGLFKDFLWSFQDLYISSQSKIKYSTRGSIYIYMIMKQCSNSLCQGWHYSFKYSHSVIIHYNQYYKNAHVTGFSQFLRCLPCYAINSFCILVRTSFSIFQTKKNNLIFQQHWTPYRHWMVYDSWV